MMDNLRETAVQAALKTKWIGQHYRFFEAVGSTNDKLKQDVKSLLAETLPAGTVYLTDFQAQGRGRLQRRWEAPAGTSLLLSLLLRPDWPAQQSAWLTMLAALSVAEAIESQTSLQVKLKWPNDVVLNVDGRYHKLCGILAEGNITAEQRLDYAIVGMGINVNIPPESLPAAATPATSLFAATGKSISRLPLLVTLLQRLEHWVETAVEGQSPQPAWNQRLVTLGQIVHVNQMGKGEPLTGVAEGTDAWGQLLVRDAAGQLHTIGAGDVTLRES